MTAVHTEERPSVTSSGDDDIDHVYCECDPDVSLCGMDISDQPVEDGWDEDRMCVVCDDLADFPCERCGAE